VTLNLQKGGDKLSPPFRYKHPNGYNAQTQVAKEGGSVAKAARKQLESKLGRSVITKDKASDYLIEKKEE
jgi:hypothetical protein